MIDAEEALPGRAAPLATAERHFVTGRPLKGPWPEGTERIHFGMGCFWGAERLFWETPGVRATAAGYMGGFTPNPTYEEVCGGGTGHAEAVLVVFDPSAAPLEKLLKIFWENHDPTQWLRQGADVGAQYRSGIWCASADQMAAAEASRAAYRRALLADGRGEIVTEIAMAGPFYFAEAHHQQYLAKNPQGYCGLAGTGVPCPGA